MRPVKTFFCLVAGIAKKCYVPSMSTYNDGWQLEANIDDDNAQNNFEANNVETITWDTQQPTTLIDMGCMEGGRLGWA